MAAVSAGGGEHGKLAGDDVAIAGDAHLHAQDLRMAGARHVKLFLAGELDLHGTPRGQGESAANVFEQHLLLAAESAADARLDDVHAADGNPQNHRHRSEEHTSELQSPCNLVCRLLLEKK